MLHWKSCDIRVPEMRRGSVAYFPCFEILRLAPYRPISPVMFVAHMRTKARLPKSQQESMEIARDVALLYTLLFNTMRRGFDVSFTLGSQLLRLPNDTRWIVNFQFGKTLRTSTNARVVLVDLARPETCPWRVVSAYLDAALRQGWDSSPGHLFQTVGSGGVSGSM